MSKPKQLLDAVKTATAIHDGDFSSLRGKSFVVCDSIENNEGRGTHVKKPGPKLTLAVLAEKIENLGKDLRNEMNAGFKQVNSRIDDINARLDYIVDANNLKDSK